MLLFVNDFKIVISRKISQVNFNYIKVGYSFRQLIRYQIIVWTLYLILHVATTSPLPFLILTIIPPIVKWVGHLLLQRERNMKDLQTILFAFSHKLLERVTTNLSSLRECVTIWNVAIAPWDCSLNDVFWCFQPLICIALITQCQGSDLVSTSFAPLDRTFFISV